eukprot:1464128-Prymnesium_polylepis.2
MPASSIMRSIVYAPPRLTSGMCWGSCLLAAALATLTGCCVTFTSATKKRNGIVFSSLTLAIVITARGPSPPVTTISLSACDNGTRPSTPRASRQFPTPVRSLALLVSSVMSGICKSSKLQCLDMPEWQSRLEYPSAFELTSTTTRLLGPSMV